MIYMQVQLNGKTHELPDNQSLASLIESLALTGHRIAVEINEELIPRSEHAGYHLKDGDQIEIVHAIGGG